ncbi:hypothetical protein AMJ85_00030 [candidate division BRC1 bacterium SM23_51]|nr:MAG: hypothetical protein AMJ85_00030 [candidate division BRC1 bacterium SM23_51]
MFSPVLWAGFYSLPLFSGGPKPPLRRHPPSRPTNHDPRIRQYKPNGERLISGFFLLVLPSPCRHPAVDGRLRLS